MCVADMEAGPCGAAGRIGRSGAVVTNLSQSGGFAFGYKMFRAAIPDASVGDRRGRQWSSAAIDLLSRRSGGAAR